MVCSSKGKPGTNYVHPEKISRLWTWEKSILLTGVPLKTYRSVTKLKFCAIITSGAFWLCRSLGQWQISSAPSTLIRLFKKRYSFFSLFLPSHRVVIHHLRILGRIDRQLVPPVYAISNICNRWHFWLQLSFNSPGSVSTQSWIYSRDSHITCQSILNHSPGAKNHQFKAIQIPIRITKLSPLTHLSLSLSLSFFFKIKL